MGEFLRTFQGRFKEIFNILWACAVVLRKPSLILHHQREKALKKLNKNLDCRIMRKDSIISLMNTFISSDASYENINAMVAELGLELNSVEFVM